MASFTVRGVDTALWTRLREKCKAQSLNVRAVLEQLIAAWLDTDKPEPWLNRVATLTIDGYCYYVLDALGHEHYLDKDGTEIPKPLKT